jgi:hypothetical protein
MLVAAQTYRTVFRKLPVSRYLRRSITEVNMLYKRRESAGPVRLRMFVRRHLNPLVAMVIIVAAILILSWGAKARLRPGIDRRPTAPNQHRDHAPIPTNIQVETFTLGFNGFEPKVISRSPGPFVLGINGYNRTRDTSFELVSEDGDRVHEVKWPHGQPRYRKLMNLPPGNYLLKEVNHPDWTAQITIGR